MTKKMQIILKEVGSENGQLTKEIHSQFWSEFDKIGTKEEIDQVVKILKVSVLYIQEFHKELWECAQASYIHRRIEKTERFMELEQDLPNMFRQALTFPEGSSNYVEAVNVFNKKWKIIQRKKDKLLDAASNHTILVADDGRRLIINQEYITKKSNSLDSRFIRIKLLFDNEWKLN
jgi:hypothetical protein